jgi:hypothetical protein
LDEHRPVQQRGAAYVDLHQQEGNSLPALPRGSRHVSTVSIEGFMRSEALVATPGTAAGFEVALGVFAFRRRVTAAGMTLAQNRAALDDEVCDCAATGCSRKHPAVWFSAGHSCLMSAASLEFSPT